MGSFLTIYLPCVLFLLIGSGLIVLEVFLPGFGLPGISGILLVAAGTTMIGVRFGLLSALCVLLIVVAVLAVLVSLLLHAAARGSMRSPLFLHETEQLDEKSDMRALLGKKGVTLCMLRPAGIGDFDGVRLNILTEGGFIEKGTPIEIVRTDGTKIIVRVCES